LIPKTIHYCWFGRAALPQTAIDCIESWKKQCPDYAIVEWNEDNFDITANRYAVEAYDARKWAFVSDYARLDLLFRCGGVYLDTDMELVKCLDPLLCDRGFIGFESSQFVSQGIIATEKGHPTVKRLLDSYSTRSFRIGKNKYDYTPMPRSATAFFLTENLTQNNAFQRVADMTVYPSDFFNPCVRGRGEITENTYAIHHYAASWYTPGMRVKSKIIDIIGPTLTEKLYTLKTRVTAR
jgi:mannosyltransferase OCH1-like enzyme